MKSNTHRRLRAGLDRLALDCTHEVEIKCGTSVYAKTAKDDWPPRYYMAQLQHILAITALPEIDFWCYLPGQVPIHVVVARDDGYIARMLAAEAEFWEEVVAVRAKR